VPADGEMTRFPKQSFEPDQVVRSAVMVGFRRRSQLSVRGRAVAVLALLVCSQVFTWGQQTRFAGRVVAVIDGGTIGVMRDGREVRVRLEGIDAPENGQDFSQRAKQFTSAAVFGKTVDVAVKETDRYGRFVARVNADGQDLSVGLVNAGLAWHYLEYSKDPVLQRAELSARSRRAGLWTLPNPTPPWEYRNGRTSKTQRAPDVARVAAVPASFLGNTRSQVVHAANCPSLKTCKYCTQPFESVASAVKAGYGPHAGRGACIHD
jgi:micrococcal nuclease